LPLMHLWLVPGVSPTSALSTPSRNTPTTAAAESSVPVQDLDFTLDQGSTASWTGVSEGEPEPFRVDRSPTWSEAEEPDQAVPSESASAPAAPDAAQGPARFRRDWTDVGRDF